MWTTKYIRRLPFYLLLIVLVFASSGETQDIFEKCGYYIMDSTLEGSCDYLCVEDDSLSSSFYILDWVGDYQINDYLCVFGLLADSCPPGCDSATSCVYVDSIKSEEPQDTSFYYSCGVILQGPDCLLFSPASGPYAPQTHFLELDSYGIFSANDTVCVRGTISFDLTGLCPEATGIVKNNTIEIWNAPNMPFAECGVLELDMGCILFKPFSDSSSLFVIDFYGTYDAGDSVCVSGILIPNCDSGCISVSGCIENNSIYAWNFDGISYEECGTIVQGPDCIVFSPLLMDTLTFALENAEQYTVGDTVCISGSFDWNCSLYGFIIQVTKLNASSPIKKYGIGLSSPRRASGGGQLLLPASKSAKTSVALKICPSEFEPKSPILTHMNLYSASTIAIMTIEKKLL